MSTSNWIMEEECVCTTLHHEIAQVVWPNFVKMCLKGFIERSVSNKNNIKIYVPECFKSPNWTSWNYLMRSTDHFYVVGLVELRNNVGAEEISEKKWIEKIAQSSLFSFGDRGWLNLILYWVHLVSISSTFYEQLFCTNVVSAAFSTYMLLEKAVKMAFVWKTRAFNVDEIDT